jgi:hypothetical protein
MMPNIAAALPQLLFDHPVHHRTSILTMLASYFAPIQNCRLMLGTTAPLCSLLGMFIIFPCFAFRLSLSVINTTPSSHTALFALLLLSNLMPMLWPHYRSFSSSTLPPPSYPRTSIPTLSCMHSNRRRLCCHHALALSYQPCLSPSASH